MKVSKKNLLVILGLVVLFTSPSFASGFLLPPPRLNDVTVKGQVTSSYSGAPLQEAQVKVYRRINYDGYTYDYLVASTTCDSSGRYYLKVTVPSGEQLCVEGSLSGYYATTKSFPNYDGRTYSRDIDLTYKYPKKFAFWIWTSPFKIFDVDFTGSFRVAMDGIEDVFRNQLGFDYVEAFENPQSWQTSIEEYLDHRNITITPEDFLFIGLAGHGDAPDDDDPNDVNTGNLVLEGTDDVSPTRIAVFLKDMQEIGKIRTNNLFLHVDCCYSGHWIERMAWLFEQEAFNTMNPIDYFLLTSTTEDKQTALFSDDYFELISEGHSAYEAYTICVGRSDYFNWEWFCIASYDPQWVCVDAENVHSAPADTFWFSSAFRNI